MTGQQLIVFITQYEAEGYTLVIDNGFDVWAMHPYELCVSERQIIINAGAQPFPTMGDPLRDTSRTV